MIPWLIRRQKEKAHKSHSKTYLKGWEQKKKTHINGSKHSIKAFYQGIAAIGLYISV
jgi:hypothetical protein